MKVIINVMILFGALLMIRNILRYYRYMRKVLKHGDWGKQKASLTVPFVLLIMFFLGYAVVGISGTADIVMAGILFGGSIFVAIIINTLEDVTEHVRETERLEAELAAAEESSRAKTAFLSNMSHEIRTPMNAIIGMMTIVLKNPELSSETREQMLKIDASAKHLLSLINDVLDMSRIESGTMEIKNEPFLVSRLIEQVGSIIESQCREKGLDFDIVRHGRSQDAFIGDSGKLRQVLINILGNSVKFTPKPGTIRFTTQTHNDHNGRGSITFIMEDTGIGMDKEYIPKIFDTFSQEDTSSTNKYGGSGLGMAITKNIVDMMGGTITVESEKGKGTVFVVNVDLETASEEEAAAAEHIAVNSAGARRAAGVKPRPDQDRASKSSQTGASAAGAGEKAAEAAAGTAKAAGGAVPAAGTDGEAGGPAGTDTEAGALTDADAVTAEQDAANEGFRVLFAEDVEINAEILSDLLEMEGFDSDWAKNGQEAVDMFAAVSPWHYDAILMDMRMPVMDGVTATRTIRSLDRSDAQLIPIIALTANAFEDDVRQCREAGMDAHISKPVDSDLLTVTLTDLIEETRRKRT